MSSDHHRKQMADWRKAHPGYHLRWQRSHRKACCAYARRYYRANKALRSIYNSLYRAGLVPGTRPAELKP